MGFMERVFGYDFENYEESERDRQVTRDELAIIQQQLELFQAPLWGYLKDTLEEIERQAVDIIIGAPLEELETARERVKLARHLARLPERLEQERARLEKALEGEPEEEEYYGS